MDRSARPRLHPPARFKGVLIGIALLLAGLWSMAPGIFGPSPKSSAQAQEQNRQPQSNTSAARSIRALQADDQPTDTPTPTYSETPTPEPPFTNTPPPYDPNATPTP